jgi:hypothetical protein
MIIGFSPNLKLQITRRYRNPDRLAESGQTAPVPNFNINREAPNANLFHFSCHTLIWTSLSILNSNLTLYTAMTSWLFGGCQAANVPTYFDIRSDYTILYYVSTH